MKYLITLLLIFTGLTSFSQSAQLNGVIKDATTGETIDYATITLNPGGASPKILGTKSKAAGVFNLKDIPFGKYTITISSIGFESKVYKNYEIKTAEVNLGNIELSTNSKSLKDVTITGEKSSIEIGIDKKTFNVDKNITAAGGTAGDILRNVPSVNVDLDGNLSVRGKDNVNLLVDGKPSAMFGNDIPTALATIPAASIESIEVITNPSSKYEAQGMGGIVNIILKKDRKPGYNGMLTLGAAAPYRLNGGLNLNGNIGKWNVYMNANARTSKTWEETTSNRNNYDNQNTYSSFTHNDRRPLSGFINIGAEYNLNKYNRFVLSENIFNANMKGDSKTTIDNEVNYTDLISRQIRNNIYTGKPLSSTTNLQYKRTFKKPGEELNMELNFGKTRYKRVSDFNTLLYDSNDVFVNSFRQFNPILGGNTNGYFQLDYIKPFGKKAKLEVGERSYIIRFKSENQPTIQFLNQQEQPELLLKNHFVFTQQVHGVYANLGNQFGSTGVQVGLRAEYFQYQGTVYQYNASATNSYLNVFPTLFVTQKLGKDQDLNFNYSKRVNRPNFYQLIPYIDVSNPQDTSMGNPNLNPEFIHATELTYSYQYHKTNTFIASVYYQYTNNLIQRYRRFNANGTTFSQNRNLADGQTYGLELTNKMNILSWWDATLNVNVFRNQINGSNVDGTLTRSGYGGFAKLSTNTKLPQGFSAQVTANYNARTVIAQGEIEPYGNVDIAIKKTLLKNLMTLTLNVNDLFNTIQTETNYNLYPYYNQTVLRKNQTRSIGLNLQIRFVSKSQRANPEAVKKPPATKKDKEKEGKNRDENLKKEDGGGDEGGGNNQGNNQGGNR
ncbi:MAG: TonB-dependent receptor [Chitinophagaceae bacterium]|nr:TonB-dependent receptor [Chitinophagaceae bacterium]